MIDGMVPDRAPGPAVGIFWVTVPRLRAFPEKWPVNDRICHGSDFPQTYPLNSEFWPATAESLMLYGLWRDYGERALCVPLGP